MPAVFFSPAADDSPTDDTELGSTSTAQGRLSPASIGRRQGERPVTPHSRDTSAHETLMEVEEAEHSADDGDGALACAAVTQQKEQQEDEEGEKEEGKQEDEGKGKEEEEEGEEEEKEQRGTGGNESAAAVQASDEPRPAVVSAWSEDHHDGGQPISASNNNRNTSNSNNSNDNNTNNTNNNTTNTNNNTTSTTTNTTNSTNSGAVSRDGSGAPDDDTDFAEGTTGEGRRITANVRREVEATGSQPRLSIC